MFRWFISFREANDWLAFDCSEGAAEVAQAHEPDRYLEWAEWCNKWTAAGEPDLDAVVVEHG